MPLLPILDGRVLVRHLARSDAALVGVMQLPPGTTIIEGAAYAVRLSDEAAWLDPTPLTATLDPYLQTYGSARGWLEAQAWPRTQRDDVIVVRFLAAWPAQDRWTVVAALSAPLGGIGPRDGTGHAWGQISGGRLVPFEGPAIRAGLAVDQLLSCLPVWPDANGVPHTLSAIPAPQRDLWLRRREVLVRVGRGEISAADATSQLKADPALAELDRTSIDMDYASFLAALDRLSPLTLCGPRTRADYEAHTAFASQAIAASIP